MFFWHLPNCWKTPLGPVWPASFLHVIEQQRRDKCPNQLHLSFIWTASVGFYWGECIRQITREDILPSGNLYLLLKKLLIQLLRKNSFGWSALASAGLGNVKMGNKPTSGQRGICVRVAYLVMRNESSRQGEHIKDEEKTCEGDGEDKKPSVSARGNENGL